jgi:hypothetical protein
MRVVAVLALLLSSAAAAALGQSGMPNSCLTMPGNLVDPSGDSQACLLFKLVLAELHTHSSMQLRRAVGQCGCDSHSIDKGTFALAGKAICVCSKGAVL